MEQQGCVDGHRIVLELFVSAGNPQRVSNPEAYGLRHLAFRTENAEATHVILLDAGYAPEPIRTDTFNGRKLFFMKDPDGLPIELHE